MEQRKKQAIAISVVLTVVGIAFCIKYFLFSGAPKMVIPALEKPVWRADMAITNANYTPYVDQHSIIRDTAPLGGGASKYYAKYIDYTAANGNPIRLLAQDKVTDSQVLYAYAVLDFYLANLSTDIANKMADNEAILIIPNGTHRETKMSIGAMLGQELYQNEISNIGSPWYMENDYSHRDAAMEEIFHLVHDFGIGTTQNPQADPALSQMIADAQQNALPSNRERWGKDGLWGFDSKDWLDELDAEGSLEQEYFVSVLDSYYGLWGAWTEQSGGMWGTYIAKTREEVQEKDPVGYEMITSFLPQYINVFMPIDATFDGTFDMNYDENTPYTIKSQYLQNIILQGEHDGNIIGNDQDNIFMGNVGTNEIDGGAGHNIVQLRGLSKEYKRINQDNTVILEDLVAHRDGTLILSNIQVLRFTDTDITI